MSKREYPPEYSIVEITFIDGTNTAFMINASPTITTYLGKSLADTGLLTLRNGTDSMVIPREQLRAFALRAITPQGE